MSDRIAEIRARLDAATPGPWDTEGPCMSGDGTYGVYADDGGSEPTLALRMARTDADLIAHAPADIAWLLDEVERWRERAERVNPVIEVRGDDGSVWVRIDGLKAPRFGGQT